MFEVIYMKADYEPWWLFEGWEQHIIEKHAFEHETEARSFLDRKLIELRGIFPKEKSKHNMYWAFWSEKEQCFCESCDDDLQIYHGLIWNDLRETI
ncbi:DUF1033 family protein [Psychrobacillus sp. INOP01]|uniref:DUF1033 family protein n=1 Tax=Psychrobacillus sp. INOP01 TaxID=2829187 RepID=UPI001BAA8306|nr:DUF1033 family protein [Psychrobacillus sp. INOP01]QUG41608.1 DUF1033 family protein [Psychrobacillus sp. INOP01]